MPDDLMNEIVTSAEGPRAVTGDSGSVRQHPIPGVIAGERNYHAGLYPKIHKFRIPRKDSPAPANR